MILKLITAPAVEPVTLSDVEAQIRASLTAESLTIAMYITAARQKAENATRRAFVTQTWDMVLDGFEDIIEIPRPPMQSVVSVKYYDVDGVLQTLANTEYTVDTDNTPGRIYPAFGKSWPVTQDVLKAVRIQFKAGYSLPVYAAFSAVVVYVAGDQVLYTDGKSYRAKSTTTAGTLPTDVSKWAAISEAEAVPACIRQWILLQVANMYENRETVIVGQKAQTVELVTLADSLLDPERWEIQI